MAEVVSITRKIERQSNQQHIVKLREKGVEIYDWIETLKDIADFAVSDPADLLDFPPPDKMIAELHRKSAEIKRLVIQLKGLV